MMTDPSLAGVAFIGTPLAAFSTMRCVVATIASSFSVGFRFAKSVIDILAKRILFDGRVEPEYLCP
jgi:hypothetical protein